MKILDLGCGNDKYKKNSEKEVVIGVDVLKNSQADVIHNLEIFPYPFKDNEFDKVVAINVIEHLSNFIKTMEEIWRITKKGGSVEIRVPYHTSIGANTDPTHKRFFAYRSFDAFFENNRKIDFYTEKKFTLVERKLLFNKKFFLVGKFFNKCPKFYERFFRYIIPAEEIKIVLKK